VIVVGAGAIGAFYGSVLVRAGCEVSVVARTDYDSVRRDGYRVHSEMLGDLSFRPAQVVRVRTNTEARPTTSSAR
jgi:2-dehydropantoate 2-reductase